MKPPILNGFPRLKLTKEEQIFVIMSCGAEYLEGDYYVGATALNDRELLWRLAWKIEKIKIPN